MWRSILSLALHYCLSVDIRKRLAESKNRKFERIVFISAQHNSVCVGDDDSGPTENVISILSARAHTSSNLKIDSLHITEVVEAV